MKGLRVIIVDDDEDILLFVKSAIVHEAPDIDVTTVLSSTECLEIAAGSRFDCILSDYQMPGMSGMELLDSLREKGVRTPFIFLTGQGNEEVAREAFKHGAYDYFTKEIGFAHFPRIINSVRQAVAQAETDRMHAAALAELQRSEARLSQAAKLAAIGIWDWEISTDRVVWSAEMFDIYGIDQASFTGRGSDYFRYTLEEDRTMQAENIGLIIQRAKENYARTGNTTFIGHNPKGFRLVRPDGRVRQVMGDAVVSLDADGNPVVMLGILMDVTDLNDIILNNHGKHAGR